LVYASSCGQGEVVKGLLQDGARVNVQDRSGRTAVYWAAKGNYGEVIELLLDGGADPNLTGTTVGTPLYLAASRGAIEAAKVLVSRGANLEERFKGYTALHMAAMLNNSGMVRTLVEGGAYVGALTVEGKNALDYAVQSGNVELQLYLGGGGVGSLTELHSGCG
jgi:ankyrin repeat protein